MNTLMNWVKAFEEKETQLFKYISYTNEKKEYERKEVVAENLHRM